MHLRAAPWLWAAPRWAAPQWRLDAWSGSGGGSSGQCCCFEEWWTICRIQGDLRCLHPRSQSSSRSLSLGRGWCPRSRKVWWSVCCSHWSTAASPGCSSGVLGSVHGSAPWLGRWQQGIPPHHVWLLWWQGTSGFVVPPLHWSPQCLHQSGLSQCHGDVPHDPSSAAGWWLRAVHGDQSWSSPRSGSCTR